jgi:hypothetical protein
MTHTCQPLPPNAIPQHRIASLLPQSPSHKCTQRPYVYIQALQGQNSAILYNNAFTFASASTRHVVIVADVPRNARLLFRYLPFFCLSACNMNRGIIYMYRCNSSSNSSSTLSTSSPHPRHSFLLPGLPSLAVLYQDHILQPGFLKDDTQLPKSNNVTET